MPREGSEDVLRDGTQIGAAVNDDIVDAGSRIDKAPRLVSGDAFRDKAGQFVTIHSPMPLDGQERFPTTGLRPLSAETPTLHGNVRTLSQLHKRC